MAEPGKAWVEKLFARRGALQAFFYRCLRVKSDASDLVQEWSSQDSVDTVPTPPMLRFKPLRANAADVAVAPGSIVERLDVFGDIFGRNVSIVVDVLLDSLLLQTAEEGLRHRVVPAVPATAHVGL